MNQYQIGVKISADSKDLVKGMSKVERETIQSAQKIKAQFGNLSQAREALSIRSEQRIIREIQRTEAAYNRLAKTGFNSFYEQMRATDALRHRVAQLNRELRGTNTALEFLKKLPPVFGGIAAAGYIIKQPVVKAMTFEQQLAHMANIAYSDRDVKGRLVGLKELSEMVIQAKRFGNLPQEEVATALNSLLASGLYSLNSPASADVTKNTLNTITRFSRATHSDPAEVAAIATKANQIFGISDKQLPIALDMALGASQAGQFEVKDMARFLPEQMALAKYLGLNGSSGFATLVAANQAAFVTSGTAESAGHNLTNLLQKINSQDTRGDFKKMGINLPAELLKKRMVGINSLDAFIELGENIVGKNTNYQRLQAKLKTSKNDSERKETLDSMANLLEGSVVGGFLQDRQALMAYLGIVNSKKNGYLDNVISATKNSSGKTETNYLTLAGTSGFQGDAVKNEIESAQMRAFDSFKDSIQALNKSVVEAAQAYPTMTTAIVSATTALTALAAAGGIGALLNRNNPSALPGVGGGFGKVGKLAGGLALFTGGVYALQEAEKKPFSNIGPGMGLPLYFSGLLRDKVRDALQPQRSQIDVKISAPPNMNVTASVPLATLGLEVRADVGRTMLGAGQ